MIAWHGRFSTRKYYKVKKIKEMAVGEAVSYFTYRKMQSTGLFYQKYTILFQ